ncbi:MAG: DegV family protein [Acidimicrobiales bacterium]
MPVPGNAPAGPRRRGVRSVAPAPVRIVTDGGADLPDAIGGPLGIVTVHGDVWLGDQRWQGSTEEFWAAVRAGRGTPSTSPPTTDALAAAFAGQTPVCALHVAGELSRTVQHANDAAGRGGRVHVVDSRSLSVGTGLLVAMVAAEAAQVDVGFDALRRLTRDLVDRVHVYAVIDDVDHLRRGGRAGLVAAATRARHRQVIAVRGHAIPLEQHRDREHAVADLLRHVADHARAGVDSWAVGHGDAADADAFTDRARSVLTDDPAYVTLLGPAVGTHAGPDALVLGFVSPNPP